MLFIHGFYLCSLPGASKARASNEKLKSARNEHKNERLYAYENVIEVVKYSAPSFFRFCTLFLSFLQNLCDQKINVFVIHLHSLGPLGSVENRVLLHLRFSTLPEGPSMNRDNLA